MGFDLVENLFKKPLKYFLFRRLFCIFVETFKSSKTITMSNLLLFLFVSAIVLLIVAIALTVKAFRNGSKCTHPNQTHIGNDWDKREVNFKCSNCGEKTSESMD